MSRHSRFSLPERASGITTFFLFATPFHLHIQPDPNPLSVSAQSLKAFLAHPQAQPLLRHNPLIIFIALFDISLIQNLCMKPPAQRAVNFKTVIYKSSYRIHIHSIFLICLANRILISKTFLFPHRISLNKLVQNSCIFCNQLFIKIFIPLFRRNCYIKRNHFNTSPDSVIHSSFSTYGYSQWLRPLAYVQFPSI